MKVMEDCGGGLTAVMVLQCPGGQGQRGEEGGAVGPRATPHCVVWRGDGVKTASGGDEGEGGLEGAQEEAGGRAWDGEGRTAEKGRWVPSGARAEGSGGSGALRRRWIREVVGPMQRVGLRGGSGGCGTICVWVTTASCGAVVGGGRG